MTPDTAPVHTRPVTDTPDPVAAALSARDAHKSGCAACKDVMPCTRLRELTAAWRRALRDSSLNYAPADSGQITTGPAAG